MTEWFERLKDQALIIFPDMPANYIENAIQRAVTRFFRDTGLLKDDVYFDAECNVSDFVLDIPAGRTIVQAKYVKVTTSPDKHPLVSCAWSDIPPAEHRFGYGYWIDLEGVVPTITISEAERVQRGKYCLTYSWTPTDKNCDIPQHFIGKYFDALEHGVLANLFLIPMPNDTRDTSMTKYHLTEFYRAIKNAGVEETQNHTDRPLYMQGGSFL